MAKTNTCQECGMIVHLAEFHPIEFCVLWKNGYNPRDLYNRIVKHIAVSQSEEKPKEDRI